MQPEILHPEILDAIAETIVETVKAQTSTWEQRLETLSREPVVGPPGPPGQDGRDGQNGLDGKDAPAVDIVEVAKQAAALVPAPKDGRDGADVDPDALVATVMGRVSAKIAELVAQEVTKAVAAIERPKDGQDGKDGKDGQSVTLEQLMPAIAGEVTKAVEAIPRPKDGAPGQNGKDGQDGQSVTLEQLAPVIVAEVTKAVEAIPRPKDGAPGHDGVGVAGALLDNAGNLVLTLSNGTLHPLGVVVGAKGDPGQDGRDGKDGADGFGFDDLQVDHDGEQTVSFVFRQGERVKSFPVTFPVPIHQGVWSATKGYVRGQCVSWGGSTWMATRETAGLKPGDGSPEKTGWLLVTKAGRDGKSGRDGDPGRPGRDGKDAGPRW